MNKKTLKKINDNLKITCNKVYLCIWNGKEITEVHTKKTLLNDYLDIKEDYEKNKSLACSGLNWKQIFIKLDNFKSHLEDNMYIKRIK